MLKDLLTNPGIPGFKFANSNLGEVLTQFFLLASILVGFLAFIWFIWGAFEYILARGDKEGLAKARARIIWAIVGLVLFLLAYTITQFTQEILQPRRETPISLIPTAYAQVNIGQEFDFGDVTSLGQGINRLVLPAFMIATILVVVFFLYGAFKVLMSAGDKEDVAEGRRIITHSIIGFILLMAAFLVLNFFVYGLFGIRDVHLIEGFR